jgi:arylformamidase
MIPSHLAPREPLSPAFVEREYNNRELVPEHPQFFTRWENDSEFVRATLACRLDLPYGPDLRHRVDLFPAKNARGLLVFIHGGYWRSLDKRMFSWLASAWVPAGVSVALLNYRLCPQVTIPDIVEDVVAAMNWIFANAPAHGVPTERVVVGGHSAGGHLTAALFAAPRAQLAFDPARIAGGVPVSGVFDFSPLPFFSGNADFRLDAGSARRLDLYDRKPTIGAPLVIAAGAAESAEFVRQSRLYAECRGAQVRSVHLLPGLHHFSVVDALAERGQPLYEAALALF